MPDPLIVDPELQAEVIRQFNLRGELSPFLLTNRVVPIFDIGRLASIDTPQVVTTLAGVQGVRVGLPSTNSAIQISVPRWTAGEVNNSGAVVNPTAGQVLADTGQLVAGPNAVAWTINNNAAISDFEVQHRDAANTATLSTITFFCGTGQPSVQMFDLYTVLIGVTNERIRIVSGSAVTGTVNATVMARLISVSVAS